MAVPLPPAVGARAGYGFTVTSRLTRFAVAGAPVYHERLCLGEMLPGQEMVIMTPDDDIYPESVVPSVDVRESFEIRGLGAPSLGVAEETIYRFYALPPDGELVRAVVNAALDNGRPVPPMPYFLDISPANVLGLAPGLRDITGHAPLGAGHGPGGVGAAPLAVVPGGVAPPGLFGGPPPLLPAAPHQIAFMGFLALRNKWAQRLAVSSL